MIERSVDHASFTITRELRASPVRVFATWSEADKKRAWFACHEDWKSLDYSLEFRPGGREIHRVRRPDGVVHTFDARYFDIVPNERIVYAYEMQVGEQRISVSLVTVTFAARGSSRARMTFTEQVAFLDGHGDCEERREGTEIGLSRIGALLEAEPRS